MISKERFTEKMMWLKDVANQDIKRSTCDALWDELSTQNVQDFERAIKDLAYSSEKINLANIWKRLCHAMSNRVESEAQEGRQREENQIKAWFRKHHATKGECVNEYNCYSCKREYCDVIGIMATRGIKDILRGERTGEEVHRELASRFKGAGFEQHFPEYQPF